MNNRLKELRINRGLSQKNRYKRIQFIFREEFK